MSAVQSKQESSNHLFWPEVYQLFVGLVSVLGFVWIGYALQNSAELATDASFGLMFALVVFSPFVSQTLPIFDKSGITYSISGVLLVATIPLYGISAAILLEAVNMISLAFVQPALDKSWRKRLSILLFNIGMGTTSMMLAAQTYQLLNGSLESPNILWQTAVWLCVAIVYDQVNLLLVIAVLRLQHRHSFNPVDMWRKNNWAIVVNVTNIFVVGGVFVLAVDQYGSIGVLAFFMPILLSAYAFRVYVSQTKSQMANLENIIAERTRELAQLNQEKDDFLAVLTHDMKSPLMSIGMYASMLQQNPQLLQQKPHAITNILRAQSTLNELVNNIVDLENLKAGGQMTLDTLPFDLNELTEFVTESLQLQASRSHLALTYKPTRSPVIITGDRLKIERVLTNLISNAIKYTPKYGAINVQLLTAPDHIKLHVMDTGYGIPAIEIPYIFERFRRVKQHRQVALGTGLGLAIAKLIVEAHNGTIAVVSEEGSGSTFTVTLPLTTSLVA